MLRLILVRHGRTTWNVQGRVQGGDALDEVGWAQAAAVGEHLRAEPIAAIYSSPALRTRQTARAVARALGLPVRQRTLLRDLDYGKFAGALLTDVEERSPGLLARWRSAPHLVRFEGGDSMADLRERIARFIRETSEEHPDARVLAVTHDSPVRMAASLALGLDDSQHTRADLRAPLASITVLETDGDRLTLPLHNYVGHLRGIDGSG